MSNKFISIDDRLKSAEDILKIISEGCNIECGENPHNKISNKLSEFVMVARTYFKINGMNK